MEEIKKKQIEHFDDTVVMHYICDNVDNKKWIISLIEALKECNVKIEKISTRNIHDYDEPSNVLGFKKIEDYLAAFDRLVFENTIDVVNVTCYYNNIKFIITINARTNYIQVKFFNCKEEMSFDDIILTTIRKQK